jgi:Zn-dependent peptidase ImmA (M78 family)
VASAPRYRSKAEKQALKAWEAFGSPVPVNVDAFASQLHIDVMYEALEQDVSGMMVTREDGSVVIVVNQEHAENRQRFSVAHELGHYFLHRDISPIFVDSKKVFYRDGVAAGGTNPQEIEANAFAAELLMPESKIRELFPDRLSLMDMDMDMVDYAAKLFKVSTAAVSFRLIRLGLLEAEEQDRSK